MTLHAEMTTLRWVPVGASACGLVLAGRMIALVYWQGPDAAEPGEHRVATPPGFSWLPVDRPSEPAHLFAAPKPAAADWDHARELAVLGYVDLTAPPAREADDISALRREAAELLRRSPWWQRELLRDELLSRRWRARRA